MKIPPLCRLCTATNLKINDLWPIIVRPVIVKEEEIRKAISYSHIELIAICNYHTFVGVERGAFRRCGAAAAVVVVRGWVRVRAEVLYTCEVNQ